MRNTEQRNRGKNFHRDNVRTRAHDSPNKQSKEVVLKPRGLGQWFLILSIALSHWTFANEQVL